MADEGSNEGRTFCVLGEAFASPDCWAPAGLRLFRAGPQRRAHTGPSINVPCLYEAPGKVEVYGLDISLGQLHHCQAFCRKRGLEAELFPGTAEALPFKEDAFEATFHIGGINFFGDRKAAIDEMVRVARPGTKVAIADERENVAPEPRLAPRLRPAVRQETGKRHHPGRPGAGGHAGHQGGVDLEGGRLGGGVQET